MQWFKYIFFAELLVFANSGGNGYNFYPNLPIVS